MDPSIALIVEQVRKKMISDKRSILVHDLGSRSELLRTKTRRVSEIARHSSVTRKYGRLLSSMAAEFGKPLIIELGTSLGVSAIYMAASCPESIVYTIEGCRATAEIATRNFIEAGLGNVKILEGSFDDLLPCLAVNCIKPGMVFIDGNHRKDALLKYFGCIAEFSGAGTVIIIDDINYSEEMAEAWSEIKLYHKVSVSIDLFRMGILFFREGINHNNYIIRY
jgi:predicted O-methyltransferase YrrM